MTTWKPGKPSHVRIEASVRCFDPAQGYGFLAPSDGEPDVFCHISVVRESGFETLPEGATVICDIVRRPRNAAVTHIHAVADAPGTPSRKGGWPWEPRETGDRQSGRRIAAWVKRLNPRVHGARR